MSFAEIDLYELTLCDNIFSLVCVLKKIILLRILFMQVSDYFANIECQTKRTGNTFILAE